jgi:hypothetical protein
VLDSETVVLGVDGVSDFNALLSGKYNDEVQLCAFDWLGATTTSEAPASPAQDQPRTPARAQARGHLRQHV